jgi:hypothetical protein
LLWAVAAPASAHINLLSPKPLMGGKAKFFRALKKPPFGAPGVDIAAAPATSAQAGGTIDIEVQVYIFHPGEIVVSWTRDYTGADVAPVYRIPARDAPIPHANLLYSGPVPARDAEQVFRASVPLPDVEGSIILVVRQVMHDKMDATDDGDISLRRVYYHQAAKLELVR